MTLLDRASFQQQNTIIHIVNTIVDEFLPVMNKH